MINKAHNNNYSDKFHERNNAANDINVDNNSSYYNYKNKPGRNSNNNNCYYHYNS